MSITYQPYTLPRLPRLQCPYECLKLNRDRNGMYVTCEPCRNLADRKIGWCPEHVYVLEMLEAAVLAGCPALVVCTVFNEKTRQHEPVLTVGADLASWEAYALRHAERHHLSVMVQLREIAVRIEREKMTALQNAITRSNATSETLQIA